jgi:hypothetical protein
MGVGREALDAVCRVYAERGLRHGQLEGRWRDCVIVEKLL